MVIMYLYVLFSEALVCYPGVKSTRMSSWKL